MKQVIFVASTSYSGSTFLDMTLGNDPKGFSIGEVNALFKPTRKNHVRPECACYQQDCTLWQELAKQPVASLYTAIFEKFPEAEFIVDSSKCPLWISDRIQDLKQQGMAYKIVVIRKTPLEIAHSFDKRGDYSNWERSWVNYHRMLYTLQPDNWVAVSYADFSCNPHALQNLCKNLGIDWFPGKEQFWQKRHHLLFGNHSARRHLISSHRDNQIDDNQSEFQTINYKPVEDPKLEKRVADAIDSNPAISRIASDLKSFSQGQAQTTQGLETEAMSSIDIKLRRLNTNFQELRGKLLQKKWLQQPATGKKTSRHQHAIRVFPQ